jgi:hypothetical protein
MDQAGGAGLAAALADPARLTLYRSKIVTVPGNDCLWWTGAVSGRSDRTDGGGHGRFWFAPGRVIIAHRFAYAVMHGIEALRGDAAAGAPLRQPAVPGDGTRARRALCGIVGSGRCGVTTWAARWLTRAAGVDHHSAAWASLAWAQSVAIRCRPSLVDQHIVSRHA